MLKNRETAKLLSQTNVPVLQTDDYVLQGRRDLMPFHHFAQNLCNLYCIKNQQNRLLSPSPGDRLMQQKTRYIASLLTCIIETQTKPPHYHIIPLYLLSVVTVTTFINSFSYNLLQSLPNVT